MKKNTKKKLLSVMLIIALLAIAVVGGSLAWFTDEDEVTNVFTVGSVEVKINEDFKSLETMLPIVNDRAPASDPNYVKKVVTIENTGKNDAFLRTWIAVPKELASDYLVLDLNLDRASGWHEVPRLGNLVVGEYRLYCYYNENALEPNDETPALLKGVYLKPHTDVQVNPKNGVLEFCIWNNQKNAYDFSDFPAYDSERPVEVVVITQAVQAEGFNNALEALNQAFGMPSQINNPFVTN